MGYMKLKHCPVCLDNGIYNDMVYFHDDESPITYTCDECGTQYNADLEIIGKKKEGE